jgi:hypothetical protein
MDETKVNLLQEEEVFVEGIEDAEAHPIRPRRHYGIINRSLIIALFLSLALNVFFFFQSPPIGDICRSKYGQ